jgi:hypothetical protein
LTFVSTFFTRITSDVVLFDLTSTYFELDGTKALESDLQRYGYSRDKRGDCLQAPIHSFKN